MTRDGNYNYHDSNSDSNDKNKVCVIQLATATATPDGHLLCSSKDLVNDSNYSWSFKKYLLDRCLV